MKPGKKPFVTKVCPACGIEKPRSDYYKKGDTVSHKCKPCSKEDMRKRQHKYYGRYSDRANTWRRERYQNDPEYRARIVEQKKRRYEKHKERLNEERRQRYATDPDYRASTLAHNRRLQNRQPEWVDTQALRDFYRACPEDHEVDHIVPIKGKIDGVPVSGLHVPWNLQYLTTEENRRKYCFVSEDDVLFA